MNVSRTASPYQPRGLLILYAIFAVSQDSSTVSADQIWTDLAAGNHRFVLGKTAAHDFPAQRKALTKAKKRGRTAQEGEMAARQTLLLVTVRPRRKWLIN